MVGSLVSLAALVAASSGCQIEMRSGQGASNGGYNPPPYNPPPYNPPPPNNPPPVIASGTYSHTRASPVVTVPGPTGPKMIHIDQLPSPLQSIWGNNDKGRPMRGLVYYVQPGSQKLPDLTQLSPISVVYANDLNIPLRDFNEGLATDPGRLEWFALRYDANFTVSVPGQYNFATISDDGSMVYVDDVLVVNNDGIHSPHRADGQINLTAGGHRIRVDYYQALRWTVMLQLWVKVPGKAQEQIWEAAL